jgi:hypothetical protein
MIQNIIIRSDCYLCQGPIEYPAEMCGEVIPCPHCQKQIKLLELKSDKPKGTSFSTWNKNQLFLTIIACAVFSVSILAAPWEIRNGDIIRGYKVSPVFLPPSIVNYGDSNQLRGGILLTEWFATLCIYAASMYATKGFDNPFWNSKWYKTYIAPFVRIILLVIVILLETTIVVICCIT